MSKMFLHPFASAIARLVVCAALLSVVLFSCKPDEARPEDVALQTAKAYYEQLLSGDVQSFLEGTLKGDTVPGDYKSQMLLNMQMYLEQQGKAHQGIAAVKASRATCDTARYANDPLHITAQSFLVICYNDSTCEEVVVPMVKKGGIWYMQ